MTLALATHDRRGGFLALAAGVVVLAGITICVALALATGLADQSRHAAPGPNQAVAYGVSQVAAFAAYVVGLLLLRRFRIRVGLVLALVVAIQVIPLLAPVLTSTDAFFYWSGGRIGAVHAGNPYIDPPIAFPGDISTSYVAPEWRSITSPYGPAFMLTAGLVSIVAGDSPAMATFLFRALATAAVLGIVVLVSRITANGAYAAAFVGWNPLVALNFAGAGHNDALMMLLVVAAIAAAPRRPQVAGALWAVSVFVKVIPLVLIPLYLLERRARQQPLGLWGLGIGLVGMTLAAGVFYGSQWVTFVQAVVGVGSRAGAGGIATSEALGAPRMAVLLLAGAIFVVGYLILLRQSLRGRARLGIAATLLLFVVLVSPQILWPWYLLWAIPLVAIDEDGWPQLAVLALCAYELNFLGDAGTLSRLIL